MDKTTPFYSQIFLIAAVGKSGQLGLGGKLPWHDPEDLRWFNRLTTDGICIFGAKTYDGLPDSVVMDPKRLCIRYSFRSGKTPQQAIDDALRGLHNKPVWICGGAKTYKAFLPLVRATFLTHVDYDGPADVYMPPLWKN